VSLPATTRARAATGALGLRGSTLADVPGQPREALEAALPALERAASEKPVTTMVEHDFQVALEESTGASSVSIELKHWPEVGPLDLVLDGDIGLELQWCQRGDTLAGCAWDIAKLACAVGERKIAQGWIVAAAPTWHWRGHRPGVDLFKPRTYVGDDLVVEYESAWRLWCNNVPTRPTHLPFSFAVTDADVISARLSRVPFDIRFARVEVRKHTWQVHVCPHRWRDRYCLPRPWDPEGLGGLAP
jgi:hypothetical protein